MDPFHERLARVALEHIGRFGFALAGGHAVQAHGMVERPSEDVDLFTTAISEEQFATASAAAIEGFQADGLEVDVVVDAPSFSRLLVSDAVTERSAQVELGMDWRAHPPTILNIGPVLHPDDAVANKVTALFSRAQARDYIDVNGALTSGRYSRDDLVRLAEEHDPGFDRRMFAQALTAIERLPDSEFTVYGLDVDAVSALRFGSRAGRTKVQS